MASKRNAQEDFTVVGQFAQWMELTGEELENFVKEVMTRRGHKPVTGWRDAVEGDGNNGDQGSSNILGINFGGPRKASGGSNWQYGG